MHHRIILCPGALLLVVAPGVARADMALTPTPRELACWNRHEGDPCNTERGPGTCVPVPQGPFKKVLFCLDSAEEERLRRTGSWYPGYSEAPEPQPAPGPTPKPSAACSKSLLPVAHGSTSVLLAMLALGAATLRRDSRLAAHQPVSPCARRVRRRP